MTSSSHAHRHRSYVAASMSSNGVGLVCDVMVASSMECTGQGNDFELILTETIETRHPVEILVVNFRRSVIAVELWRPEVARLRQKCPIFAYYGEISTFCSARIRRLTDRRAVCKFREIWPTENR